MGRVRNLKILKGVVYAEVNVGSLDNGGWVTMNVKVGPGEEPAVQAALRQLDEAIAAVAERHLAQSSDNRVIEKRVDDRVAALRKSHEKSLVAQRQGIFADAARRVRAKAARITTSDPQVSQAFIQLARDLETESTRVSA